MKEDLRASFLMGQGVRLQALFLLISFHLLFVGSNLAMTTKMSLTAVGISILHTQRNREKYMFDADGCRLLSVVVPHRPRDAKAMECH